MIKEISIPVFENNTPKSMIGLISKAVNDSSYPIKFLNAKKSSQWWISDDNWNIIIPDAVSISLSESSYKGGGNSPVDPLAPLAEELNNSLTKIFLSNGFVANVLNTGNFDDYVIAFQKDETRCTIITDGDFGLQTVACSDNFQQAYDSQIPYLKALNDYDSIVSVQEKIGDFTWLNVHFRRTGHLTLVEEKNGKIKLIFSGQESPYCKLMYENNVPKEVYKTCYDEKGNIVK